MLREHVFACQGSALRQSNELGPDLPRLELEEEHRVERAAAALRRGAGVENPGTGVPLDDRQMRVAEEHRVAPREASKETVSPPGCRARDVNHPEPDARGMDDVLLRQALAHGRLVGVAVNGLDRRADRRELIEKRDGREVAPVEDQVGAA
jgi:hypothetical protein